MACYFVTVLIVEGFIIHSSKKLWRIALICAVAAQPLDLQSIRCTVGERAQQSMWSPSGPQAVTMNFFFHCPWTCWKASAVPRSPPLSPSRWEHPKRDPQHHLAFGPAMCFENWASCRCCSCLWEGKVWSRGGLCVRCPSSRMLSPDLETDTTAEDTLGSSPNGETDTPASLDVREEVNV